MVLWLAPNGPLLTVQRVALAWSAWHHGLVQHVGTNAAGWGFAMATKNYHCRTMIGRTARGKLHMPSLPIVRANILPLVALVAAFFLGPGCRKEELVSTDPGLRLEFSQDTVLFDTIFTVYGSVTKRFTARNTSNSALRVSRIALEGGSTSPYRLNVDGVPTNDARDVEILAGDSIYIFVEVTIDPSNVNLPFLVEDRILFQTNGNDQLVLLSAYGQDAHFIEPAPGETYFGLPGSIVAGNGATVTWPNDKPYVVRGYAIVDSGSTLIIDPGTRIYMHNGAGLWVYRYGQLSAIGTTQEPITFQGDRREPEYAELPGQWDRIWINEGPSGADNRLENVVVKNALVGIQCEPFPIFQGDPSLAQNTLELENVAVRNSSIVGLLSRNARIEARNLLLANCGQHCAALTGAGNYDFNHVTLANFWSYSIRQTPAFLLTNTYGKTDANSGSVTVFALDIVNSRFRNTILYGSNSEEFEVSLETGPLAQYEFTEILLRTAAATSDLSHFPDQESVLRNVDPGFVNASGGDFHLRENSAARDRGTISSLFFDLDGNPRDALPDLGCYEYTP
jgi:hypothetical protein